MKTNRTFKTQKQKIIEQLNNKEKVSNFWAIKSYILRLGARMYDLKQDGWEFKEYWGKGKERKNWYYEVTKKPCL